MTEDVLVPWEHAWHEALYGPTGFYRRPEGPGGHFATSAQGIPHGSTILARAVVALARRHDLEHVVDVGAGAGALAGAVAALAPDLRVTALDVVVRPASLPDSVVWQESPGGSVVPAGLGGMTGALVLAHEWLDVVPCPVVQRDEHGVWRVVAVDPTSGREELTDEPTHDQQVWLRRWMPATVQRTEVGAVRDGAWAELAARVDSGLVVAVDYGHTRVGRPVQGSLTGYRRGRQVPPVPDGSCDLTAHVALDSLAEASAGTQLRRQEAVLDDLLGPSAPLPHDLARAEPTTYLRRLAEQSARRALSTPGGLGDFCWALLGRGTTVSP